MLPGVGGRDQGVAQEDAAQADRQLVPDQDAANPPHRRRRGRQVRAEPADSLGPLGTGPAVQLQPDELNDLLDLGQGPFGCVCGHRESSRNTGPPRPCAPLTASATSPARPFRPAHICERFALSQLLKRAPPPCFPGDPVHARLLLYSKTAIVPLTAWTTEVWSALEPVHDMVALVI
jgi:hypothetical protein